MTDQILILCSLLFIVIGLVVQNPFYKISGFMTSFGFMVMAITKDATSIIIMMITGVIIHLLLLLSYKEYNKNDD